MTPKIRIIISVLVGVALAALIAFVQTPKPEAGGILGKPFGGNFAGLTDEDGKPVTAESFAGQYELVFFGFTYCPSICPTELQKIASVLKKLPPADAAKITPIFVSVDPERDTPKLLKDYTALHHPAIIGLTGTEAAIEKVKKDWKVYAAKTTQDGMSTYMVDHSAFLYFRAPDGRLLGLFSTTDTPAAVLESVKASLTQDNP
ncbi:MAG: SCO family protein [Proteobacteria bacterium]|nr:SCO family protein [Pseudomonadota bacterium]